MRSGRKRKILLWLSGTLVAFLLLLLLSPVWFPWLLSPVLKRYGVRYSSYERVGYWRFALHEVSFSDERRSFQARRVEIPHPIAWAWNQFVIGTSTRNFAKAEDWSIQIKPAEKRVRRSTYENWQRTEANLARVREWLPHLRLRNGTVDLRGRVFKVPDATWSDGELRGEIEPEQFKHSAEVHAVFAPGNQHRLKIDFDKLGLRARLALQRGPDAARVEGEIVFQTNRLDVAATFAQTGRLPESALLESKHFRIPAEMIDLEGYKDLTGKFAAAWQQNEFRVELVALAEPRPELAETLSPVSATVHARGDTNAVRVETADISAPWMRAKLSEGFEMDYGGRLLSEQASFEIEMDLSKQYFLPVSGAFRGEAFLRRSDRKYPDTTFQLGSAGFRGFGLQVERAEVRGELLWPWFEITAAEIRFAEGGTASASARLNAAARLITDGTVNLRGRFGDEFLPPRTAYRDVTVTASFGGSLRNISHSARAEILGLTLPNLKPLDVTADWRGTNLDFEDFKMTALAGQSSLLLTGSAQVGERRAKLAARQFKLSRSEETELALEQPFSVALDVLEQGRWRVELDPFHLRGRNRELLLSGAVHWPRQGSVHAAAAGLDASLLRDFISAELPGAVVRELMVSGRWSDGPITFLSTLDAGVLLREAPPFSVKSTARGGVEGIRFERLSVSIEGEEVLFADGTLPIAFEPGKAEPLQIIPKQRIDFAAATRPAPHFWEAVTKWTRIKFSEPEVNINISGTVDQPEGSVHVSASRLEWTPRKTVTQELPAFENLDVEITLNRKQIEIDSLRLTVEGQPLFAEAELALPEEFTGEWRKVFDWREIRGHLVINDAQVAPFSRFAPDIIAPEGSLDLKLEMSPGPRFDGTLVLRDAGTRPIPALGALQNVDADLRFTGRRIEIHRARGLLAGQPVGVFGSVDLGERKNDLPLIDLQLRGEKVPLARRPDIILRSDLNLAVSNLKTEQPLISGTAQLRDSVYIGDLKPLIPGKVARPKRRPPYFSVEREPFAAWRLDVRVRGDDFLRVQSPLFRGVASANFRLEGALDSPRAIGEAAIDSGIIQFPFANFTVNQGHATLTSDDPYQPQLFVTASSRAFGYDLKMELTGPADQPVIEFSSTPALASEQIILMVTAGEMPARRFAFSAEQRASRLALFLGKSFLSKFGIGGAERLTITSGENISEQGEQTYALEYRINEDWAIVAEYDRFGALNAGVKWRVYSR